MAIIRRAASSLAFFASLFLTTITASAVDLDSDHIAVSGDFNGDGLPDALAQPIDGTFHGGVLLRDSSGDLSIEAQDWDPAYLSVDWSHQDSLITALDLNGDLKDDVIVQPIADGTATSVLYMDSDSQLLQVQQLIPADYLGFDWSSSARQPLAGDFDGDGKKDLFMQPLAAGDAGYIVHADSSSQFSSLGQTIADGSLGRRWARDDVALYVGDFNGDGRADLLMQVNPGAPAAAESDYALLLADSSGQFSHVDETWNKDGLGGDWDPATHSITIEDVNGDGIMDIVVTSTVTGGTNYVYLGNVQNAFIQPAASWTGSQTAAYVLAHLPSGGGTYGSTTAPTVLESTSIPGGGSATAQDMSGAAPGSGTIRAANAVGVLQGSPGVSGGSAGYSIPLAVAPGIAGMQPSVGLSYSSRGGNGEAGMGWSLSAGSQIHRCPATRAMDKYPYSVQFGLHDRLCLDGQHLILAGNSPVGYGKDGALYRTELDSFTRITEVGDATSATSHFTVDEKGGRQLRYGYGTNVSGSGNAVFTPSGAAAPLTWALGIELDQFNNSIIYTYSTFGTGEHLLTSIKYTGSGTTAGNREVDFTYGTRGDPSSQYLSGGLTTQTQILSSVTTSENGAQVRSYAFEYQLSSATHRSLLIGAQECAGSGASLACLPVTTFNWHAPGLAFDDPQDIDPDDFGSDDSLPISNLASQAKLSTVGDLDGDGRKELLYYRAPDGSVGSTSRLKVYFLASDGSLAANRDISGFFTDDQAVVGADMDNDGATDLVGPVGDGSGGTTLAYYGFDHMSGDFPHFSTVHDLGKPYYFTVAGSHFTSLVAATDVDGDGYTDLVMEIADPGVSGNHELVVYLNQGDCNSASCTPSFGAAIPLISVPDYSTTFMLAKPVGDLDGNGLPDFGIKYRDSAGNTQYRTVFTNWTGFDTGNVSFAAYNLGTYDAVFMDINGDGLPDVQGGCTGSSSSHFCYQLNTGNQGTSLFTSLIDSGANGGVYDNAIPGDFENSGATEFIYPYALLADYCVDYTNVMVGGEPESVPNICANDTTHPSYVSLPPDYGIYKYHRIRFVPVTDGSGGVKYQTSESATNIIAQNGLTVALDLQGDGLTDVISPFSKFYSLGHFKNIDSSYTHHAGMSIDSNTSSSVDGHNAAPDLMLSAVDGFGYTTTWDYYPLSSGKTYGATGAQVPLYAAPVLGATGRYAGGGYFYFASSMYVVGDYKTSDGIGGTYEHDFHYGQAIYNGQGRGFQGFRTVVDDDVDSNARTVQVYHQRFPLSGELQETWTTSRSGTVDLVTPVMDGNAIAHTVNTWDCMQATGTTALSIPDGNGGTISCDLKLNANTYVPVLKESLSTSLDISGHDPLSTTDTVYCAVTSGACAGYGYDQYGNSLGSTSSTTDAQGTYTSSVANTYATADTTNWWLDKLTSKITTVDADYTAGGGANPAAVTRETDYDYYTTRAVDHVNALADGVAANKLTTTYVYSAKGNVTSVSVNGGSGVTALAAARTTTTTYTTGVDADYFVATVTNPASQVTTIQTDPRFGTPSQVTAVDGVAAVSGYDVFGRKASVKVGNLPVQTIQYAAADGNCDMGSYAGTAEYYTLALQDGAPSHLVCYDMLNRALRGAVDGFASSQTVYQDTQYDSRGRVKKTSEPYFAGDTPLWNVDTYSSDMLGRIQERTDAKGVTTDYAYDTAAVIGTYRPLVTTITTTDPAGTNGSRVDQETRNSAGKMISVTNAVGVTGIEATTGYAYDSDGNPVTITAADGSQIVALYNVLGQKLQVTDPDQGLTTYTYDVLGELLTQYDAKGQTQTMVYDSLGRMVSKTSPEGTTTWCYEGKLYSGSACAGTAVSAATGKLSSVAQSWDGYQQNISYDSLGRVAQVRDVVDSTNYDTDTAYNSAGQVDTVTYPAAIANNPPNVTAVSTAAQYVLPSAVVTMSSGATDTDGPQSILTQWVQTAGPSVTPSSSTAATMHFTTTSDLGKTYTFKYAADDGLSGASASASVIVPGLPAAATASTDNDTDRDGSYVVSWTATPVPGTSVVYHLEEASSDTASAPTSSFTELTASTGQGTRTFTGSHPGNGHYYYWYRVKAEDALTGVTLGQGPYSDNVSIHLVVKPGSPASISPASGGVDTDHGYTISWGARTGSVQSSKVYYELYEATASNFSGQSLVYSGASLSHAIPYKGTGNAGDYYYRVRACNSDGSITTCSAYTSSSHFVVAPVFGGGGCPPPPLQCQFVLDDDGLTAVDRHPREGGDPVPEEAVSTEALASLGTLDLPVRDALAMITDEPVLEKRHRASDPIFDQPIYKAWADAHLENATNPTPIARFSVHYVYTESGYVKQLTSGVDANRVYWTANDLNARGQVLDEQYGAGLTRSHTYDDASGFETHLHAMGSGSYPVQDLNMTWDGLGNLQERDSTMFSGSNIYTPSETFSYDVLNRLTRSQVHTNVGAQDAVTYTYNLVGNITCKSDLTSNNDCSSPIYTYGGTTGGPHAVTAVGSTAYTYDQNGNMATRNGGTITWSSDNLPLSITNAGNSSAFNYGPDKHRYKQIASVAGTPSSTETTLYFGAQEQVNGANMEYRHTLTAYGEPVAQMTLTSDGSGNPVETMHYLLADHLGSVDTIIDDAGAIAPRQSFDAFGKRRNPSNWHDAVNSTDVAIDRAVTHRGFTQHEELDNLDGLVHANGRVFDAKIGRFLSVDPVYQAPTNSQSVNPYSYVMNNPLSLVDPSGYCGTKTEGDETQCSTSGTSNTDSDRVYKGHNDGPSGNTGSRISTHTDWFCSNCADSDSRSVNLMNGGTSGKTGTTEPKVDNSSGSANQVSENQKPNTTSTTESSSTIPCADTDCRITGSATSGGTTNGDEQQYVNPTGKAERGRDAAGNGDYGSKRRGADGRTYEHQGEDYLATPGQEVVADISGRVTRVFNVYKASDVEKRPELAQFRGVEIVNPETGMSSKLFYVQANPGLVNTVVHAGEKLGTAQDRGSYDSGMQNHVHVEMRLNHVLVDPRNYIRPPN